MSIIARIVAGMRVLANRPRADADVADEIRHYLDQITAANIERGMSPHDARRAASIELGNTTVARERVRAVGWENTLETLLADLRVGVRRLRRAPAFTLVSAVTLALGIGASAAIVSAVYPVLFQSLPYKNAARIVTISDRSADGSPMPIAFGTYREVLQRSRSFDALAVLKPWQPTYVGGPEPERLSGQRVSASYFTALGVRPALGRGFTDDDDRISGPNVVLLSDGLWRRRFGADPAILGHDVRLDDDNEYLVIGVMPPRFENIMLASAEVWAPLQYNTALSPDSREWGHHLQMVGLTRAGTAIDDARRELNAIGRAPLPDFPRVPWASMSDGLLIQSLHDDVTGGIRPALLAVLGAVALLLAIACVNVTNLLLARGAQRRGELAMRAALGAERGRLIRQLLTESVLLAGLGGLLGVAVAWLGVQALVAASPPSLPRVGAIRIDGAVLGFALTLTMLIGLVVGMMPALQGSRDDLRVGLQQASRRTAGDHRTMRSVLVVVEVALALVLLVGAGLLLRSVQRLFAQPVGFDTSQVLTMQVQAVGRRLDNDTVRVAFFDQALAAARAVPGVTAAAFTQQLPLSGDFDSYGIRFEDSQNAKDDNAALRYAVTPDYFAAMRIPLIRGRLLDAHDTFGAPRSVLVNQAFANRRFTGRDAIGQRLKFGTDEGGWYTIVGIVGDVRQTSLAAGAEDAVYLTMPQWHWAERVATLVVKTGVDPASLVPSVKRAVWSVDRNQGITRIATMRDIVAASEASRRFVLMLFEAFALVALVLAATGLFGVLSGSVTERTREIGIRAALGASRANVLGLIVRQGMRMTVAGVVVGLGGAVLGTRLLSTLLFDVSNLDPVTYVAVALLLGLVSIVASGAPAWRAAAVDPATTLRSE
jgi:putative ABC transport system permease protein